MLQAEESGRLDVITADYEMDDLFRSDFEGYVATMNRRLRKLDSQIAAKEAAEAEPTFRELVARDAIVALAALGIEKPNVQWRLGVVATRVWLLQIASESRPATLSQAPEWRGDAIPEPCSPYGEWLLWSHVSRLATVIRGERLRRSFGPNGATAADLEEARLRAEIPNDQWAAMRARAAWVLR